MFTLKSFDDINKVLTDLSTQINKLKKNTGLSLNNTKNVIKGWLGIGNTPQSRLYVEGDAQGWRNIIQTMLAINDTDASNSGASGGRIFRIFNRQNVGYISKNLYTPDGTNWNLDQTASGGHIISLNVGTISILFATAGTNPRTLSSTFSLTATTMGFWGSTAASKQVLNSYTSNSQSSTYLGIATGVAGTPYAQVNDLNSLRIAYENLRQGFEDLRTKMQNSTFVG